MQRFAYDHRNILVEAERACRGQDYRCPECTHLLHVKISDYYRTHFFHLTDPHCRHHHKNHLHLAVQQQLCSLLPKGEVTIEKIFPEIHRIADLVWKPKRLVIEVQCSPIPLKEILERNRDYSKMNFRVLWVLHDRRFNQHRVSAAELFLRGQPSCFTNIDIQGNGMLYTQRETFFKYRRLFKGPPIPLHLEQVIHTPLIFPPPFPPFKEKCPRHKRHLALLGLHILKKLSL